MHLRGWLWHETSFHAGPPNNRRTQVKFRRNRVARLAVQPLCAEAVELRRCVSEPQAGAYRRDTPATSLAKAPTFNGTPSGSMPSRSIHHSIDRIGVASTSVGR